MPPSDQTILDYVAAHPGAGRDDIRRHAAPDVSSATVWRALKKLLGENKLQASGKGPATTYTLAGAGAVRAHLATPFNRRKPVRYSREFLDRYVPGKSSYLAAAERQRLREAGRPVAALPAGTYARRILERLLVDLSWASSRMEGNTYSILDTERLIRFGREASGKDRKEAVMILNHKEAIQYVVENLAGITISRLDLLSIHALLSDGLLADPAMVGRLRRMDVGIVHSSYRPLENPLEIEEEFHNPDKAALAYRDFVREAVRRSVLGAKAFHAGTIMAMAVQAGIPEADRQEVVEYVGRQFRGLHEGNVIRYRLRPADLEGIKRE